jgi:hypothetical protein
LYYRCEWEGCKSWEEELNDYKNRGLYYFSNEGEWKELLKTLTNLSETVRKSGFRVFAKPVDKKIRKLETKLEKRVFKTCN